MAAVAAAEDQQQASEKAAAEAEAAAKAEAARKEGYEQGVKDQQETLLTCFRFLRLAGFRRAMPDENAAENEAIEKVLIMVYSSEESATAAIESLAASKDEVIEGSEGVTCKLIFVSALVYQQCTNTAFRRPSQGDLRCPTYYR